MTDPIGVSLVAILNHTYAAVPIAMAAGTVTSIGPCVAPRYLALAVLIGDRRPLVPLAAFVAGVVVAYVALGFGSSLVMLLFTHIAFADIILAVTLIAIGVRTLVQEPHLCSESKADRPRVRPSSAFTLGAASALVVSPCCTPMVVAFAGLGVLDRDPVIVAVYLAAFALGHAAPLALVGAFGAASTDRLRVASATAAPSVIAGTLTIALGCYYGLLA